jgi:hypothetical protein
VRHLDLTKKRMGKKFLFPLSTETAELLRLAALQQEISRADFIRQAIKEKAARVLTGAEDATAERV